MSPVSSADTPNCEIGPDCLDCSFAIADVYEGYENEPSVVLLKWTLNESNDDARSMRCDEFLPREFELFVACPPKLSGRPPERDSGKRENSSEESNNLLVVVMQEVPDPNKDAPNISDERAGKGGAVFFGGILLAGVVAYLIARRKQ
jgi:hypothetical protein